MNPLLDPDRLFPSDPTTRRYTRDLYERITDLPIISPHGHTDPNWFADNNPFEDATSLFLTPDHYVLRLLRSHGLSYDDLGVQGGEGKTAEPRAAWRLFAAHYYLFTGTPSQLWIDHALSWGFGIEERLTEERADYLFDLIRERLTQDDMRPRAILKRANIELIATTEYSLDSLKPQAALKEAGLTGQIVTTYRPDDVTDPDHPDFLTNLSLLGEITDCDTTDWKGMIEAHRRRRAQFRAFGAKATDHGVPTAHTAYLSPDEKQALLERLHAQKKEEGDAQTFRAQMLTEMAALSVDDGMVMQIHAGVMRNTDPAMMKIYGANKGADIPCSISPVHDLAPLLQNYGARPGFRLIFFGMDETAYARELAPMAGYWPALMVGPPWWFHDSPRGIARYLDAMVETAGFYNLAGFNDDTRALLSIPVRHDVWRRGVACFLGELVASHLLSFSTAAEIAQWLAYEAAKKAYKLTSDL